MKKLLLFFLSLLFLSEISSAQCLQIDSLRRQLRLDSGRTRLNTLNALAQVYREAGQDGQAYNFAKSALSFAKRINKPDPTQLAEAWINNAQSSYSQNQNASDVLDAYSEAIRIYSKGSNLKDLARVYALKGGFFHETSYVGTQYLDSAANNYKQAFQLYEKEANSEKAANIAGLIAEIYFEKGEEAEALEYSKKSLNESGTEFSKANIIKRALEDQAKSQVMFNYMLMAGLVVLAFLAVLLIRGLVKSGKVNQQLERQKSELETKNEEVRRQKDETEKARKELEETARKLEIRNQEMDRLNREIMLQQHEIEMQNVSLGEKNEELHQQQEEILTQRDNLEKQATELKLQKDEVQRSYKNITILSRIGQSITSSLDFKEIFDTLYGYVVELMPADGFRVTEYHAESSELEYKFNTENQIKKPLIRIPLEEKQNPAVWCVRNRRSILIRKKKDFEQYEELDAYSMNRMFNSMIYFPLFRDEEVIGTIGVYSRDEDAYDHLHLDMVKTLASYTTIAISNAETYEILNAAQDQLVEAEKMAALGSLVAGVAHEINTPVGICVTAASRLESKTQSFKSVYEGGKMKRKDLSTFLETTEQGNKIILTNLSRAADLVQGFKRVAVEQSTENKRVFNLKTYLEETVMALNPEFKNTPYKVHLDAEEIEINSYAGAFSQIITNLAMNSLIHGFKGREEGQIDIRCQKIRKNVVLTYRDNGNGMSTEILNKLYEPFFTTNREGGGTGLGMNIVYNLAVQKLGGKLEVKSQPGKGVEFVFEIPLELDTDIAEIF